MSRLAKKPIVLPQGVEVSLSGKTLSIKGPKGTLSKEFPEGFKVELNGQEAQCTIDEALLKRPFLGLYTSLFKNLVIGVSEGFVKKLSLIGVGYRAAVKGANLDLQLGFSHPTSVPIPDGINVKVDNSTLISIEGSDKQLVGQFAATVRDLRPPEPYKGKGVRYENEFVRKKAGKSAKK